MVVQFEDGNIKAYKINEEKKTYSLYWELAVTQFKEMEGGEAKKA